MTDMSRLRIDFAGVHFKNPIIPASGTFGYGREFEEFYPLSELGGISVKGTTGQRRTGNLPPRIAETPSGMLNSVGLQNPGIDHFIADFYCHAAKLIIELDGSQHYEEQGIERDKERTAILEQYGLNVIRFSNLEIKQNFQGVCTAIDLAVKERMNSLSHLR